MNQLTSPVNLIKKSWNIFSKKENLIYFVKIYLPLGILAFLSLFFSYIPALYNYAGSASGNWIQFIYGLLFVLVATFVNLAGIIAISGMLKGEKPGIQAVYNKTRSKYFRFFLLTIVIGLILALGLVLLIIPFILFATWFAFSKYLFVEKGLGIKAALTESKNMVKGKFWKILGRLTVFALFSTLSQMVLSFLPYGVGSVVFDLFGALFILPQFLLFKEVASEK